MALNISSFEIKIQRIFQLAHQAFISLFYSHILLMILKKWSVKCRVFRSEYQKFSARAARSHCLICEIPILFVNFYKKFSRYPFSDCQNLSV